MSCGASEVSKFYEVTIDALQRCGRRKRRKGIVLELIVLIKFHLNLVY